ncbi:MAG: DUF86 domain-containing protein [Oscillospiraceae bacterium]|nr:DUF86 domain-containing protein [Oscillospiraceae bacterium]
MNDKDRTILEHMIEDACDIINFSIDLSNVHDLIKFRMHRKAIVMSILNIGELTKQLSLTFKQEHKEIPWKKISGMRDIAAHGYHIMDNDVIWIVITHFIPELIQFLNQQLRHKEAS